MKKYEITAITERPDNSVIIELFIPKESPYFDGHFPQVSILPAVAQVDIVLAVLRQQFNNSIYIAEVKKAKFTNLIMPLFPLVLELKKSDTNAIFKISSPDGETVYSMGTLIIKEE